MALFVIFVGYSSEAYANALSRWDKRSFQGFRHKSW